MSSNNSRQSGGITFVGALQVLFIYLKLTNQVDWPWGVVLLPFIIELLLIIVGVTLIYSSYNSRR